MFAHIILIAESRTRNRLGSVREKFREITGKPEIRRFMYGRFCVFLIYIRVDQFINIRRPGSVSELLLKKKKKN